MIRTVFKWGAVLAVISFLSVLSYGFYVYRQVRDNALRDDAHPADAIVVLGAAQYNGHPSPVFKARLDHAYQLFHKGYAHSIVTTGSFGPDPNFSEAQVGTRYLEQRGVDPSVIVTQQSGGTTYDSIRSVCDLLQAKGWKDALVVSDGFHLFRLKRMFNDIGFTAYTSPAPASPIEASASQRLFYSLREVVLFSAYRLKIPFVS
jgi:uncharacterized SAM-binding protein YcdF (DUF218 family)